MIQCKDGSYYTGHTKNFKLRYKQHEKGVGAKYTRMHKPEKLVYTEKFLTRSDAIHRERTIKTMTHKQKQKLVNLRRSTT
jgi:putative endonuclease